jgi:hypothetical protein
VPKAASPKQAKSQRGRGSLAIEASTERGIFLRMLLHSPKDMVAGTVAFAAVTAIIGNAIFLQAGRHPSPMFGSSVTVPLAAPLTSPLPKPRPLDATAQPDAKSLDARLLDSRSVDGKAAPKAVEPRGTDPIANVMKPATPPPNSVAVARPPAPIPNAARHDPLGDLIVNSRRVAAVQRALTEYGYGQLKATGTVGSDTQAAIQRFERERKLPVTGQMSDRLVRELGTVTGRPID